MSKIRWHIIQVPGITNGAKIPKIEFRIPNNVRKCEGLLFSSPTGFAPASKNHRIGIISLHVNDKKKHPVHLAVQSKSPELIKRKCELHLLNEPLQGNSFVQGYYIDEGFSLTYPYTLNIYLKCLIE